MTADITHLAQIIGNTLSAKGWEITCAESCTGGGIGYAITSISGSSAWFKQGFITYANEAKRDMLGISEQILERYGAVSSQTVEEMAKGAAKKTGADVAISVSGIAGPGGGTPDKPVGTVWFGFAVNDKVTSIKQQIDGDRQIVRLKAVEFALSNVLNLLAK